MSAVTGRWLITGAAGAIGGALAVAVRERWPSAELILVDVDQLSLGARAAAVGGPVEAQVWDLSDTAAIAAHWAALPPVDCLVNCAGVMDVRTVGATPWADAKWLLDIDLMAPLELLARATPGMVARRRGLVINVASMAGVTPIRGCAYYGAAKAGLAMASEIARAELAGRGVQVVTVYPGPVASALERGARAQVSSWLAGAIPTGDAAALVREILAAVDRGRPRVVYPRAYRTAWAARGVASWVTTRFSPAPDQ